jgi:adenylosuccinate synthase
MEYLRKGKANVVIDGQWGSTGKGKLVGYIAKRAPIDVATCDFQTNAGHTWIDDSGKEVMVQQLPTAFLNPDCQICINADATIDLKTLLREVEKHGVAKRLHIHPHAGVILQEDKASEQRVGSAMEKISSTQKGCGAARARKIRREAKLAVDFPELGHWIADTSKIAQDTLYSGGTVLVETAQGFDLSLNHGVGYPYTTSRDITVTSALSNAGIPPFFLGNVWGSLRSFPIRVGNMFDGHGKQIGTSGPGYKEQQEYMWDEITKISGAPHRLEEITTVTKKVRRIFAWSVLQLMRFISFNHPTHLFINFMNYIDWANKGKRHYNELSPKTRQWTDHMYNLMVDYCGKRRIPTPLMSLLGTGEFDSDMVEV